MKTITELSKPTLEKIIEAFVTFPYDEKEDSQFFLFKSRKHIEDYLACFLEGSLKNGTFYSYENKAFAILSEKTTAFGFMNTLKLFYLLIKGMGFINFFKYMSLNMNASPSLESRFRQKNKNFLHLEMVCVLKEFQQQGLIKDVLEKCLKKARRMDCPLILETDCKKKSEMYKHLGFHLISCRKITSRLYWYDFQKK